MKLKEDIKIKWIDRLRSTPEEGQIMGHLKRGSQVCAVGALFNLAAEAGVIRQDWEQEPDGLSKVGRWALPDEDQYLAFFGWSEQLMLPSLMPYGTVPFSVIVANDNGVPWPEIADAIKQDL